MDMLAHNAHILSVREEDSEDSRTLLVAMFSTVQITADQTARRFEE